MKIVLVMVVSIVLASIASVYLFVQEEVISLTHNVSAQDYIIP